MLSVLIAGHLLLSNKPRITKKEAQWLTAAAVTIANVRNAGKESVSIKDIGSTAEGIANAASWNR